MTPQEAVESAKAAARDSDEPFQNPAGWVAPKNMHFQRYAGSDAACGKSYESMRDGNAYVTSQPCNVTCERCIAAMRP